MFFLIFSYYDVNWIDKFQLTRPFQKGETKDKSNEFAVSIDIKGLCMGMLIVVNRSCSCGSIFVVSKQRRSQPDNLVYSRVYRPRKK